MLTALNPARNCSATVASSSTIKGLNNWCTAQRALSGTHEALEMEHATFERLMYKNNSQHKGSLHWRHLKEVLSAARDGVPRH